MLTDNLQDQISPSFSRVQSNDHSHACHPVQEVDSSVNTDGGSFRKPVGTFCYPNSLKDDTETGIKIRSRQPRNTPSLMNNTSQGTAPRRMRLGLDPGPESDQSDTSKEDESESISTQV